MRGEEQRKERGEEMALLYFCQCAYTLVLHTALGGRSTLVGVAISPPTWLPRCPSPELCLCKPAGRERERAIPRLAIGAGQGEQGGLAGSDAGFTTFYFYLLSSSASQHLVLLL